MTIRNRHPADELADVRAEIKQLQIREAELRDILLAADDRVGVQYTAVIANYNQQRLDRKALLAHFGKEALQSFCCLVSFQSIKLIRSK